MNIEKKIKQLDYTVKKALGNNLYGLHKSFFLGSGIDFSEHKEYISGESIKNIDWKASAKGEKFYSKRFEEDRDIQVLFVLDTKKSMDFGLKHTTKKDVLEEVFYSLAYSAYKNSDSYAVMFFGQQSESLDLKKDKANLYTSIKILESKPLGKETEFGDILKNIVTKTIKNHLIFFITDELIDNNKKNVLKKITATNEIVYIHVYDEFENSLSGYNGNILLKLGNTFQNLINWRKTKKLSDFQNLRQKKLQDHKNFFYQQGIRTTSISTSDNTLAKLLQLIS